MKVKFENCEVELWKVKKGTVVMQGSDARHIESIGQVWEHKTAGLVLNICTKGMTDIYLHGQEHISNDLTWIEPH